MAKHSATVKWQCNGAGFLANKYSRAHTWHFDGGAEVAASASPHIVPLPFSCAENVDPEEAFIAAIASCHMLFFLSIACEQGFHLESYEDNAIGRMAKNKAGKIAITHVQLHPRARFAENLTPDAQTLATIHHLAHDQCFIANSILSEVELVLPHDARPESA